MALRIECTKCKETKGPTQYSKSTVKQWKEGQALGYQRYPTWCKSCQREYNTARYDKIKKQNAVSEAEKLVAKARVELAPAQLFETIDTLRVDLSQLRTTIRGMTETVNVLQQTQLSMNRELRALRKLLEKSILDGQERLE